MMSIIPRLNQLYTLYQQKAFSRLALYTQQMASKTSDEAVRWIESVSINGEQKMALFMHPDARASYVIHLQPGMQIETAIALLPEVWGKNTGGVEYHIEIRPQEGEAYQEKRFVKPSDRQWIPWKIDTRCFAGQTVTITLETRVPQGASGNYAWAVWGEPSLVTPRPKKELVQKVWDNLRQSGFRATAGRVLHMAAMAEHAGNPYQQWIFKHQLSVKDIVRIKQECEQFGYKPKISIITPVYNVDSKWLKKCIESVKAQYYTNWELCMCDDKSTKKETVETLKQYDGTDPRIKIVYAEKNGGISAASNRSLSLATGEFVALMDNDDEIPPEALYEIVKLLNKHKDADMVYTDEDKLEMDGYRSDPFFKPDWSPEYFLSCMYTCHLGVYRHALIREIGGFRPPFDKAQDYDLVLRVIDKTKKIHHIPKILYHWRKIPGSTAAAIDNKSWDDAPSKRALEDYLRRNNRKAEVLNGPIPTYHRIRYAIIGEPHVSIIIPTTGNVVRNIHGKDMNFLVVCLRSIFEKTTYKNYEIIVAVDKTASEESMNFLKETERKGKCRILCYNEPPPFSFAHKMNFLARHVRGEHILFLNDDIEVIAPEWMTAMLEFSQQKDIGMVGAKLYFPDKTLQHVGVVLGIGGVASHVFREYPGEHGGYFTSTRLIRNYSAVTAACSMLRREIFEEVGGFDETLRIDFNDVDLCLRIRKKGYRIVYTAYAELYHHESISFGSGPRKVAEVEQKIMLERWKTLIKNDPLYNPNLTRKELGYQLHF